MKNVSFMQLILGTTGALLIYAGIKNVDIQKFLHNLVTSPSTAFSQTYSYPILKEAGKEGATPSVNTTPATGGTTKSPVQNV